MIEITAGFLLLALSVAALLLQNLYHSVSAKELKRLARQGDSLATRLYRPVAYGEGLWVMLWLAAFLSMSFGLLIILPDVSMLLGFVLLVVLIGWILIGLPTVGISSRNAWFAAAMSVPLAKALYYVHPLLDKFAPLTKKHHESIEHNHQIYEQEDLLDLLDHQKQQSGNRIAHADLGVASRALRFHGKQASDILLPRKATYMVNASDSIGPVLLDQLHKSGQNLFLVYRDKRSNIIGYLSMTDAIASKEGGQVNDLVKGDLIYLREDFSLKQVIEAFQKTGKRLAVVINKFEDYLGTVSLEDTLKELVGNVADELNDYENRSAVASFGNQTAELVTEEAVDASGTSPEETEVIE
jgi:CBS domain containing-hemolysin-like protein